MVRVWAVLGSHPSTHPVNVNVFPPELCNLLLEIERAVPNNCQTSAGGQGLNQPVDTLAMDSDIIRCVCVCVCVSG